MKKRIVNGQVDKNCFKNLQEIDHNLAHLIAKLLVHNPEKRLSSQKALQHVFFKKF